MATTLVPTDSLENLRQQFQRKIESTSFPFRERALKIRWCMTDSSCCLHHYLTTQKNQLSSCELCCGDFQVCCIKGVSNSLSCLASLVCCAVSCGIHTCCLEYRGYRLDHARIMAIDTSSNEDQPAGRPRTIRSARAPSASQPSLFAARPAPQAMS